MINAWANLPNAKHIDRIFADVQKNPDKWADAMNSARDAARVDERYAAWDAARVDERAAIRKVLWYAARNTVWYATVNVSTRDAASDISFGAISALTAWDDCAYLLDEKPEDVLILALLGNQAAILIYPACVALQSNQNSCTLTNSIV